MAQTSLKLVILLPQLPSAEAKEMLALFEMGSHFTPGASWD
jgi:hypothetical protein